MNFALGILFRMGNQQELPRIAQLQMLQFLEQQNQVLGELKMFPIKEMVEILQ